MIVKSFQDFKFRGKQIYPTFSHFLVNNALLCHFLASLLAHNKKMNPRSFKSRNDLTVIPSLPVLVSWFCSHRK